EQTAVVQEAGRADQIERLRTESRSWRADPDRTLPGCLRQILDGLGEQSLLLRRVSDPRPELVDPSVDADFVTMPRQKRRHHLGMQHDAHRGNEERGRHLMPIEEVENPRY